VLSDDEIPAFRNALLQWFDRHQRDLPWRRTSDPYAIWISEIMLQQTRVAAVIPYYERFLARFPTYSSLARAAETDLLSHWAGLGYYHRARNLQRAAKQMDADGAFPADYPKIRALPGVGDYTAAAVASIAFQLPHAAVDGNVLRVLSRVCADSTDIASSSGRQYFAALAERILDRVHPGAFNQAMMELGATICFPSNPQCLLCPVSRLCGARAAGRQTELPISTKQLKTVQQGRVVFWIEWDGRLLAWQRPANSRLMPGFWELPESSQLPGILNGRTRGAFRHAITFHNYRFEVVEAARPNMLGPCEWVPLAALDHLPVSTILRKAQRTVLRSRKNEQRNLPLAASSP